MSNEHELSRGVAKHRRTEIAQARRTQAVGELHRLTEVYKDKARLDELNGLLTSERPLPPKEGVSEPRIRAELTIEQIWLRRKLELITEEDKTKELSTLFNLLEKTQADVYSALTSVNPSGITRAHEIRNSVIPPVKIAGFHTKR